MQPKTQNIVVTQRSGQLSSLVIRNERKIFEVPLVDTVKERAVPETKLKSKNHGANLVARDLMKRFVKGRNWDWLSSFEKQKYDVKPNAQLAVPVLKKVKKEGLQ